MNGLWYEIFSLIYLGIFWGYIITWSLRFILWILRGCTNNIKPKNKKISNKEPITDGYVAKSGRVYK